MVKKLFLVIGILVVVGIIATGATAAAAVFGTAQKCASGPGPARNDAQLLRLLETSGLTVTDAEATALIQKSFSQKVSDPRVCFTPGLVHFSGNLKLGSVSPSFYVSTGIDLTGTTPKTKNLDIRVGSVPNIFLFTPVEKMIESMINDNLSKARMQEKFSVEFSQGTATIKKLR